MKRLWSILLTGVLLTAGGLAAWYFGPELLSSKTAAPEPVPEDETPPKDRVVLTQAKYDAAHLKFADVTRQPIVPLKWVPGRIEYNARRHTHIKAPSDGVIREILVRTGDTVEAGQPMCVIDSPDIGERRADVQQREADLKLARRESDWWHEVQSNLGDLIQALGEATDLRKVQAAFQDRTLGDYRNQLIGAYSRFLLADRLSARLKPLADEGLATVRSLNEQISAREIGEAEFSSLCEQARFEVQQKRGRADSAFADAERRLAIARQRLFWLTGGGEPLDSMKEESLSTWPLAAPLSGTVEEVPIAPLERVKQGDDLMLVADTTHLYVQADIRERDWAAIHVTRGQMIEVRSPALAGRRLEAKVSYMGRSVVMESRAVPLIAEIDNPDGLLRPGMFVRVALPEAKPREVIAIPESAVVGNEGRVMVFVVAGEREFLAREVKTGVMEDGSVEVVEGLQPGERIVTEGAFVLKSELLLEPEE